MSEAAAKSLLANTNLIGDVEVGLVKRKDHGTGDVVGLVTEKDRVVHVHVLSPRQNKAVVGMKQRSPKHQVVGINRKTYYR